MKLRSPRNWSPSSRSSFSVKAQKAPATGLEVPATSRGWKGRTWPGQGLPWGPESRLKIWLESCSASAAFQGMKIGVVV